MFSLASGIYQNYFAAPKLNVLVIGLEGSGKTTLLERIKVTQFATKPPRQPPPPSLQRSQSADVCASPPIAKPTECRRALSNPHLTSPGGRPSVSEIESDNTEKPLLNGKRHEQEQNESTAPEKSTTTAAPPEPPATPPTKPRSRFLPTFSCPAPKRYSIKSMKEDEDEEEYAPQNETVPLKEGFSAIREVSEESDRTSLETSSANGDHHTAASEETPVINNKQRQFRQQYSSRLSSMDSVDLTENNRSIIVEEDEDEEPDQQQEEDAQPTLPDKQYNVLSKKQMLPLHKIRPTSGTNLAKNVAICGCQVFFFDVSGKFQDLWSSYYDDADAIIFCVGRPRNKEEGGDDDTNDIIDKVRQQIEDDVPFLIWVVTEDEDAVAPPLSEFLPHYSSNLMQVFAGSNWTGYGVKEALEWLIPMAKRMKTQRQLQLQLSQPPLPPKEV